MRTKAHMFEVYARKASSFAVKIEAIKIQIAFTANFIKGAQKDILVAQLNTAIVQAETLRSAYLSAATRCLREYETRKIAAKQARRSIKRQVERKAKLAELEFAGLSEFKAA